VQGWYSVRREWRKWTWAFLGVAFFFLFAWSMMFYSRIYRFTFIDWPFFGAMTVSSFVALLCSTGFAIMCLRNYDKGLAQWSEHNSSFVLLADSANDETYLAVQYMWRKNLGMMISNLIYSQLK
jgi:hypothetical protein